LTPGYDAVGGVKRLGGVLGRRLGIIDGQVADVPNRYLRFLERHPGVARIHYDPTASLFNYRTSVTVGALTARQDYNVNGQGVGVAIIDSGITSWNNDLMGSGAYGNQRVTKFVDL